KQLFCLLFSGRFIFLLSPFLNCFFKTFLVKWFEQIINCMSIEGFDSIFIKCSGKYYSRAILDKLKHLKAIDLWHLNVQDNQVGFVLLDAFYSLVSITAYLRYNKIWKILNVF